MDLSCDNCTKDRSMRRIPLFGERMKEFMSEKIRIVCTLNGRKVCRAPAPPKREGIVMSLVWAV